MRMERGHRSGASSPVTSKERTAFEMMRTACTALESALTPLLAEEVRREALLHEGAAAWTVWEQGGKTRGGSCLFAAIDAFVSKNGQGTLGWRTEGSDILGSFLARHFGGSLWQHAVFREDDERIELRHAVH